MPIKEVKGKVICTCGCDKFRLRYGHYEIIAICIDCGEEDSVYSG